MYLITNTSYKIDMELKRFVKEIINIRDEFNIATGLIMEYKEYFVFSIQNKAKWRIKNGNQNIGLVGIGGGQEGNETIEECLVRECKEEINENVKLIDEKETILLNEGQINLINNQELNFLSQRPYAITVIKNEQGNYREKPYTIVFSYRTVLQTLPVIGDIFGLVLCPKQSICNIDQNGMMYEEWIKLGTKIITKENLEENSKLIPFGTFKSFIILMKEQETMRG